MKTTASRSHRWVKAIIRHLSVMVTVFATGGGLEAAEPSDLKTFSSQESYVAEAASIVLTQRVGEATIKVGSALKNSSALTAANGAKFDRDRELPSGLGIYRLQSGGAVSDATSQEAIDSLNQ